MSTTAVESPPKIGAITEQHAAEMIGRLEESGDIGEAWTLDDLLSFDLENDPGSAPLTEEETQIANSRGVDFALCHSPRQVRVAIRELDPTYQAKCEALESAPPSAEFAEFCKRLDARDRKKDLLWECKERGLTEPEATCVIDAEICTFNPDAPPPPEDPVISFGGVVVGRAGKLSMIQGQDKSGKTSLNEGAIAAVISGRREGVELLGWTSCTDHRLVLHFDCEQSESDHWAFCSRVFERAGIKPSCDVLKSYCLTGYGPSEVFATIEAIMRFHGPDGIALVVIDGYADLVADVNDQAEAIDAVTRLMRAARETKSHITGVLHLNPPSSSAAGSKARGHLGSQFYRKAETVLEAKRESGGSGAVRIFTSRSRKARTPELRMGFNSETSRWELLRDAATVKRLDHVEAVSPFLVSAWGASLDAGFPHGKLVPHFRSPTESDSTAKAPNQILHKRVRAFGETEGRRSGSF